MERHPLDLVSLTAGLIFVAAAVVGLSGALTLGFDDLRWIGPGVLVLFGVVLVATSVSRNPSSRESADDRPQVDAEVDADA